MKKTVSQKPSYADLIQTQYDSIRLAGEAERLGIPDPGPDGLSDRGKQLQLALEAAVVGGQIGETYGGIVTIVDYESIGWGLDRVLICNVETADEGPVRLYFEASITPAGKAHVYTILTGRTSCKTIGQELEKRIKDYRAEGREYCRTHHPLTIQDVLDSKVIGCANVTIKDVLDSKVLGRDLN